MLPPSLSFYFYPSQPANFLLTDTTSLVIKIADFGMSQLALSSMTESSLGQSALHQTGGTKGTTIHNNAPDALTRNTIIHPLI